MAKITKQKEKPKTSGLLQKILDNSNSDMMAIIDESSFFNDVDVVSTDIPILNLAFSGRFNSGFSGGLITIAGPSKHFKSSFGLASMKAFQQKNKDGVIIFYDSEGGITLDYMRMHGIDTKRVLHDFVTDIEELKHRMVPQLDGLERGDPVMFFVDSVGNLSSKREYDNAIEGNTAADYTRAKELKSLTRLINGKLKIKKIPCIMINHSYQTLELYSKSIVGGGTGIVYSSDTIFMIGRSQDKNEKTKEIEGWNFTITIDKSRFVKEKSKFVVSVKYNGGISKYSGLAELAEEVEVITSFRGGYEFKGLQTFSDKVDVDEVFWKKVFTESKFNELIEAKFRLGADVAALEDTEEDSE